MKTIEQKAKKVPTIRFAGFDDEWIGYKIADISSSYSGGTPSVGNANYYNGDIPFIRSGEIYESHTELFLSKEGLENSSAKMVEEGYVLYALYGATSGEVCRAKISGAINQALLAIIPKEKWNSDFLVEWFRKEKSAIVDNFLQGGQGNLSAQIIKDLNIKCPSDKEQQKIGSFFSNIDSLISLEQKKYDKLTQVKKSMLEKMFPKEGATVPEIRFAGFTGDWEEKKLSDEFVDFIVPMRDKPKSFDGKIPWTRIEDIEGKFLNGSLSGQYVSEKTIAQMNLKVIPKNSLIVSSSATFGVVAVVTQDLITNQTFIGLVPNDKESLDFWYIFFYSDKAREYMKSQSAGSTIFYIARESFENMPVMIPSREEQQKIGSYFSHLDSLISLQQRKLEKLKNVKKSLLEKMFV